MSRTEEARPPVPLLRVVRGAPTEEELAALVAVVSARVAALAAEPAPSPQPRSWAAYWRSLGTAPAPGPGAWRASGLPR